MKRLLTIAGLLLFAIPGYAQVVVPPITAECATSIDGSVVGTPNPLNPPIVAAIYSGTLGSGTYFVEEAWYDAATHTTLVSPEVQIQLTATGEIQENTSASGLAATVVGRKIYIGTSSGSETLQGSVVGTAAYYQSVPLVSGTAIPSLNTTVCQIIANDAGWPTGTGYQVTMTSSAGATFPGYPQQWQLLGPGNTINLGQGIPFYNGTVSYPIPILARPYGHGPQSISGPLSVTSINASVGYLFNGAAPLNHILMGNGSYYVDASLGTMLGLTAIASVTAGPGSGTSSSITCTGCLDNGGLIAVETGGGTPSGAIATVTFGATHAGANCTFSLTANAGANLEATVTSTTTATHLELFDGGVSLDTFTLYEWTYVCTFH